MEEVLVKLPALLAGVVLVAAVATDAVSTLVTTQRRSGRWWPTYVFYRRTWRLWRALARHILVIGYLPTLFNAYSRREAQLLVLDDLTDERTSSTGLIEAWHADGGLDGLAAAFADWERWCAEVFDSHTAYPMLALFRSRQPGQHWLTALGVVTDAAAICLAAVRGPRAGPALRLHRRATALLRTVGTLPAVSRAAPAVGGERLRGEAAFQAIYRHLEGHGVSLYPYDRAWEDLRRLRAGYLPNLRATIEVLLVPPEFRNHATPLPLDGRERER
jgi:hypothetical protein